MGWGLDHIMENCVFAALLLCSGGIHRWGRRRIEMKGDTIVILWIFLLGLDPRPKLNVTRCADIRQRGGGGVNAYRSIVRTHRLLWRQVDELLYLQVTTFTSTTWRNAPEGMAWCLLTPRFSLAAPFDAAELRSKSRMQPFPACSKARSNKPKTAGKTQRLSGWC